MPLTFDLPFEQLLTYQGSTPRPADFDAYWNRALSELDGLPADVEIVPARFQAPFARCAHCTSPAPAAPGSMRSC